MSIISGTALMICRSDEFIRQVYRTYMLLHFDDDDNNPVWPMWLWATSQGSVLDCELLGH